MVKYCQVSKVCIIYKYVNILKFSFLINLSMNNYFSVGAEVVNPMGVPEPQGFKFLKSLVFKTNYFSVEAGAEGF